MQLKEATVSEVLIHGQLSLLLLGPLVHHDRGTQSNKAPHCGGRKKKWARQQVSANRTHHSPRMQRSLLLPTLALQRNTLIC